MRNVATVSLRGWFGIIPGVKSGIHFFPSQVFWWCRKISSLNFLLMWSLAELNDIVVGRVDYFSSFLRQSVSCHIPSDSTMWWNPLEHICLWFCCNSIRRLRVAATLESSGWAEATACNAACESLRRTVFSKLFSLKSSYSRANLIASISPSKFVW